jgi:2-hydroxychromene-2-carboxylate isomerase
MSKTNNIGPLDDPLTVLHWYDFVCPFCYLGQQRTAILVRDGLQVIELPFQIHPEIPLGGIPAGSRNGQMYAMLEREAKEAGLTVRWPPRLPNTRRALKLPNGPDGIDRAHSLSFARRFLQRILSLAKTSKIPL